ncbi:MAG: transglycosylase domain-containing protein, partial [Pseudomonadota bacterium]|nr:transglycosylase domain-containing protein [Pseudomonadota bacterium]
MPRKSTSRTSRGRRRSGAAPAGKFPRAAALWRVMRPFLKWGTVCAIWLMILGTATVAWFSRDIPSLDGIVAFGNRPAITLLASDGSMIGRYGDFRGRNVRAEDLPDHLVHAILATEDRRFYSHFGIDPVGIARAILTNIWKGRMAQGGSTITQQLAKNLFLSPDRTLKRKIQEAILSLQLERRYTKNQILSA